MINLIVASNTEGIIGKDNDLLWKIPDDLKYFKSNTKNNTVIMGRKTYQSIGKPLPDRQNIIITRNKDYEFEGCILVNSLEDAIFKSDKRKQIWIIGGSQIYKLSLEMDIVDTIYQTEIHQKYTGDKEGLSYFNFDKSKFREENREDRYDKNLGISYSFIKYIRNK